MSFVSFSPAVRFRDFAASVQYCTLCPRLCGRRKVLSDANGTTDAHVLFLAEAPGRLGADRTGIPLHGDRTGDNFEALLGNVGWSRDSVFITNSVLCNPRDDDGNNGTPTAEEVMNCSYYLRMTLQLINPAVVVTLGATALRAVDLIASHGRELADAVGMPLPWAGRVLFPLYHPGPRALVHRGVAKQRGDFIRLANLVHPVRGLKKQKVRSHDPAHSPGDFVPAALHHLIVAFVQASGPMTWFKLTKLLYLADLYSMERHRKLITGETYIRQAAGPWLPRLERGIYALAGFEIEVSPRRGGVIVSSGPAPRFDVDLPTDSTGVFLDVVGRYGSATDAAIKTVAYLTKPMKYILREERKGRKMLNRAVLSCNGMITDIDARQESD